MIDGDVVLLDRERMYCSVCLYVLECKRKKQRRELLPCPSSWTYIITYAEPIT